MSKKEERKRVNELVDALIGARLEESLHRRLQRSGRNLGKLREKTSSLLRQMPPSLPAPVDDVIDIESVEGEVREDNLGEESSGRALSFRRLPRWYPPR